MNIYRILFINYIFIKAVAQVCLQFFHIYILLLRKCFVKFYRYCMIFIIRVYTLSFYPHIIYDTLILYAYISLLALLKNCLREINIFPPFCDNNHTYIFAKIIARNKTRRSPLFETFPLRSGLTYTISFRALPDSVAGNSTHGLTSCLASDSL